MFNFNPDLAGFTTISIIRICYCFDESTSYIASHCFSSILMECSTTVRNVTMLSSHK